MRSCPLTVSPKSTGSRIPPPPPPHTHTRRTYSKPGPAWARACACLHLFYGVAGPPLRRGLFYGSAGPRACVLPSCASDSAIWASVLSSVCPKWGSVVTVLNVLPRKKERHGPPTSKGKVPIVPPDKTRTDPLLTGRSALWPVRRVAAGPAWRPQRIGSAPASACSARVCVVCVVCVCVVCRVVRACVVCVCVYVVSLCCVCCVLSLSLSPSLSRSLSPHTSYCRLIYLPTYPQYEFV